VTPRYKMHLYEQPTGLKFVLITDPKKNDQSATLKEVYDNLFVPLVAENIFLKPGDKVESKLFDQKLNAYLIDRQ
jgi:trafficking protein particle complex subunit 1